MAGSHIRDLEKQGVIGLLKFEETSKDSRNKTRTIRLVRDNKADFNQFGQVGFEIRARLPGHHGGGDTEHAILNERN